MLFLIIYEQILKQFFHLQSSATPYVLCVTYWCKSGIQSIMFPKIGKHLGNVCILVYTYLLRKNIYWYKKLNARLMILIIKQCFFPVLLVFNVFFPILNHNNIIWDILCISSSHIFVNQRLIIFNELLFRFFLSSTQ